MIVGKLVGVNNLVDLFVYYDCYIRGDGVGDFDVLFDYENVNFVFLIKLD